MLYSYMLRPRVTSTSTGAPKAEVIKWIIACSSIGELINSFCQGTLVKVSAKPHQSSSAVTLFSLPARP